MDTDNDLTSLAIIRELRLQNTPASLRVAEELAAKLLARTGDPTEVLPGAAGALSDWIPSGLVNQDGESLCQWLFARQVRFTDPFFTETLNRCKALPVNLSRYRSFSSISALVEWAKELPPVNPSGFIFHVSRCGSTLISQMLALDPENVALSEVPLIDDLLRLPYRKPKGDANPGAPDAPPAPSTKDSVQASLAWYGRRGKRLFVKTDNWHISFYSLFRSWYPDVPFFLLYRSPDQVLSSHRHRRGMQSVPGLIEPEVLWGSTEAPKTNDLDSYMARVLAWQMERFIDIGSQDKNAYLLNYSEGVHSIVNKIAKASHTPVTDELERQMEERSRFHAKFPGKEFKDNHGFRFGADMLAPLNDLYAKLEARRTTKALA